MAETNTAAQRRGWYYGWNIIAVLILAQLAGNGLTYNAFSLFVKGWHEDLHARISDLMLCITAMVLVSAPLSPIVGAMADKYPAKWIFGIGLVGMGAFYLLASFATEAWQLVALFAAVAGPMLALSASIPANAVIARWFVRRLGFAMGLGAFGIGAGGVLIPPLVGLLLPDFGWRAIWRFGGLFVIFIVMPLVVAVVRDRPTEREGLHYVTIDEVGPTAVVHGHGAPASGQGPTMREVLMRRNFWLLVIIYLCIMGSGFAFNQNLAPIAAKHGLRPETAGLLIAVSSAAHVLANLVLGLAADRYGSRVPLVALAISVGVGAALIGLGGGTLGLVIGAALIGANAAVFTPVAIALAAEFGPSGVGKAFGMIMFFVPIATSTGFILARSEEATGSYAAAAAGFVAVVVLAVLLCFALRPPRGPAQSEQLEPSLG
ncbi:MAG: MFS transporter [Novosphingobium sp.]|nr:MFS transporter [Novosphingobium sp.]